MTAAPVGPLDRELFAADVATLRDDVTRPPGAAELAGALVEAWSEPHRRYHTVEHLTRCLEVASETCTRLGLTGRDAALVRAALWFHDAVYDPRRTDNEERSADLAVSSLRSCGVSEATGRDVHRLVMVTAGHSTSFLLGVMVVDADLAVLAADPASYAAYVSGVRAEYAHVDDVAWSYGRAGVLTKLLNGLGGVFHTAADPEAARAAAHRNLQAELAALT